MTTPKPMRYGHLVTAVRNCGLKLTKEIFLKRLNENSSKGPDNPNIIYEFLKENEQKLKKDMRIKYKLRVMFPRKKQEPLLDQWDLSLFCNLLLDYLNVEGDLKTTIDNLKFLRNRVFHHGGCDDIPEKEYNRYIRKLKEITDRSMEELNNDELKSELDKIIENYKNIKVEDVEEALVELKEWYMEDEEYRIKLYFKTNGKGVDEVKGKAFELKMEIEKQNPETDIEIPITIVISEPNEQGGLSTITGKIFVKNIHGDLRFLGDVESSTSASVTFKFTCSSVTLLIYLLDYFSGPIFQRRLFDFTKAIEEMTDDLATLHVYVPQKSYEEINKIFDGVLESGENYRAIAYKRKKLSPKIFNDPLYGQIEFHLLLIKIIDTPQFQRLRYIKQLETVYLVYPGASHNRFEHSIGVCHLAGKLLRVLKERQPELDITAKDILCVEIAALCHDLGQGPFSHVFEQKFIPMYKKEWKHETASVAMFETMLRDNKEELYRQFMQISSFEENDITFIKELIGVRLNIIGDNWPYEGRNKSKSFLYEVVSNPVTGIDVDRWDYIARDSYMLGMETAFDHNRCIHHARVLTAEGRKQICYRDKAAQDLYDMFYARITLYKRAYQHKTHNIIGLMVRNALRDANDYISFVGKEGKKFRISDTINDMEAYTNLTDYVFQKIQQSSKEGLEKSKATLERIVRRDFYKCVCQTQVDVTKKGWLEKTSVQENLFNKINQKRNVAADLSEILEIDVVNIDYGSKDKDPVANVWFYKKGQEDTPIRIDRGQVSFVLPDTFAEQYVRVYCSETDSQLFGVIEESFAEWCQENNIPQPKGSSIPLSNSSRQPFAKDAV